MSATPPTSILVRGSDRSRLDELAVRLARHLGDRVYWIELIDAEDETGRSPISSALPAIEPEDRFRLPPSELRPNETLGHLAVWHLVRDAPPSEEVERLTSYVRLPPPVRSVFDRLDPGGGPATLVVSNADRAAEYYPSTEGALSPFLDLLTSNGLSVVLTSAGPLRASSEDFAVRLWVRSGEADPELRVVCERGAVGSGEPGESQRDSDWSEFLARIPPRRS